MDCKKAKSRIDFLQYLETDISVSIMSFLHDPADLVRASSVSHTFGTDLVMIENGFAKELCLKTFSGCSNILCTRDHEVYANLLYALQSSEFYVIYGIMKGIYKCASSTNNYLLSYTPPGLWAIDKFCVRPCPAEGSPIVYSANSVRFIIGHAKSPRENETDPITDDEVEWTYTSPEFPMKQEHKVQAFKLSQPVLFLDGYLKIELLGRVQTPQKDGLFYIWINISVDPFSPCCESFVICDQTIHVFVQFPSLFHVIPSTKQKQKEPKRGYM
ncbi:hypothetical protein ACJIZ3_007332 [Penstemon smallii]|uniref:F-box protein n=1 Tax=Penstemon smallii TaxID=265156 RepID=A0ABD3SAE5_9LAMI